MISSWQDKNKTIEEQNKPIKAMTGMGINPNNSYSSYGEALQALKDAKRTGSTFVFEDLKKRSKK